MALTQNRYTDRLGQDGRRLNDPVAEGVHIHAGALVVLNANGYLAPATTATDLTARGVASSEVDNTSGSDGAVYGDSEAGVFCFDNDGSIDRTAIGGTAYAVDDHTVAADDGGATRSAAGPIVDVDDDGAWIRIGV